MATAQANAAAPLDQLLVDVGAGPLRCWPPGRPGVEFIASLAGKPGKVGRRLSTMVSELLGREPPVFGILSWSADTTRMSAALHRDFLTVCGANQPITPGGATMMGTPVDLSAVRVDNYVVAGVADDLRPWQNCYQSTQPLGGDSRFVLSTSGAHRGHRQPAQQPEGRLPGGKREVSGHRAKVADVRH
jgi:hypothetical protein